MRAVNGLKVVAPLVALLCLASADVGAQEQARAWVERCRERDHDDRLVRHCELKEQTLPAGGTVTVDGGANGGIAVRGWDRNEVLVQAKIVARAETEAEARRLAEQVRIATSGGTIRAEGPDNTRDANWHASFDVYVPRRADLALETANGGITIADVRGRITFEAQNGGIRLRNLGGAVRGHTTNGGVSVELTGERWDGEGLDVRTTNGGVELSVPASYSAHLEAETTNGGVDLDFPITVQGRIGRRISADLGQGGPPIRVTTTNGGVRVQRS